MTNEEWRPVVGWEGLYEVSSHGRVRSLDRYVQYVTGHTQRHAGRILRPTGTGHPVVALRAPGRRKTRSIHSLVADAFIPNPKGDPWVLHWDDDSRNNKVENLRWGTPRENSEDCVRNGSHYWASRDACSNGHELSPGNTRVRARGRICLTCERERGSRYRDRKRQRGS